MQRALTAAALLACVALLPMRARADAHSAACIDAHEHAQRLTREGKLRAAREQLLQCSRDVCPKVAQTDCAQWLRDVARDTPSVVFAGKNAGGQDTLNVHVSVDGERVVETLDGRAWPLDPGPHLIRFEWENRVLEQRILLGTGEQNRRVIADFSQPRSDSRPARPPVANERPALPAPTYVFGGIAALSLGSFAFFGLQGKGAESCVPQCKDYEIQDFRRSYVIADVSLGLALVSAGAALYFALAKR